MQFHPTQSQVASSNARFRVVNCGRQWGKTTLSVWEMLACAYAHKDRRVAYFAPTFIQARDIAWNMLKQATSAVWAKPPNETRLELTLQTQDGGTSEIFLKGFESVESARGQQFDLLVLDEVSKMRNFMEGWNAVLLPTLLFRKGSAMFISTPYGYNWFHDLYQNGMRNVDGYQSFHFTTYDNPHIESQEIERMKQTMTQDYFAQEHLAQFVRFTGLIYKEFDITKHVEAFDHEYNQYGDYYFGLDFAVRGYSAMLVAWMKPNGHLYILDEYKVEGETAQTHSQKMHDILIKYAEFNKYIGYADPAGFAKNQQKGEMLWSLADEYLEHDFPIGRANNEVIAGINYVRQLFLENKLHIHPRCTMLVDEIMQYQWKDQPDGQHGILEEPEKVRKFNDHLVDGLRYLAYSKPIAPEEERIPPKTLFPAVFPLKIDEPDEDSDQFHPIDIPSLFD